MRAKLKAVKEGTGISKTIYKRLTALNDDTKKILGCILRFAAGWLLSQISLFGTSPLALGFVGACGGGFGGLAAALGTVLGAVTSGSFNWAVKYSAITLLIYAAAFIFKDIGLSKKNWFMPLTVGLMTALTGFVYARHSGWGLEVITVYIAEILLAGCSCRIYITALNTLSGAASSIGDDSGYISRAILGMSLALSLVDISLFNTISIGRCAAAFAVMAAAFTGGAGAGCITGLALGMALDAAMGSTGVCVLAYGFGGMFSGFYMKKGRLPVAVCYVLANAVGAYWGAEPEIRTALLYEAFIASVLFMLPPNELFFMLKRGSSGEVYKGAIREKEYMLSKARLAATAFDEIYEILKKNTDAGKNDGDLSAVFDVAAEEVCRYCKKRSECWGLKYEDTRNALNDASFHIGAKGSLISEDLPSYFRESCLNLKDYIQSVNNELKALYRRRQFLSRLRDNRELLYRQYEDMAKLLRDISVLPHNTAGDRELKIENRIDACLRGSGVAVQSFVFRDVNGRLHVDLEGEGLYGFIRTKGWLELISSAAEVRLCCTNLYTKEQGATLHLFEAEPLVANVGIASLCKEGQEQNGDMATYFKTAEGILYLLISDGMGSGKEAASDSSDAVKIAEKLLKAGLGPDLAMSILNSAMLLRSDKNMGCASVDLMAINLFSGETLMFKYGAAPSYVRKNGKVFEVNGESLAAGLSYCTPDLTRLKLAEGSAAVIISDGAAGNADEIMLKLSELNSDNVKSLAGSILESVARKGKTRDDMTVLTVSIEARS
jgi:stage II sporulation protein E